MIYKGMHTKLFIRVSTCDVVYGNEMTLTGWG